MKLKIYDATTVVATSRHGKHSVNMNYKTGLITFSRTLVASLKAKKNTKYAFAQDQSNPKDWYIYASPNGFDSREKEGGMLMLNSTPTARAIAESAGIDYSTTYLVGKEPTKVDGVDYWPILTKSGIKQK